MAKWAYLPAQLEFRKILNSLPRTETQIMKYLSSFGRNNDADNRDPDHRGTVIIIEIFALYPHKIMAFPVQIVTD